MEREVRVRKSRFERILGIIILIIIAFSTYGVVYWVQTYRFPVLGEEANTKVFYITATMWEFYPKEITVQKGDHVEIHLTSVDAHHGFYIEAWNISADLFPNQTVTIDFTADKVGKFEYYCTVYCGIGHPDMRANVIVKEKEQT
ncbi:MAG: cupredoxin domain-containing protein [Nitrososphaerales archaeon]